MNWLSNILMVILQALLPVIAQHLGKHAEDAPKDPIRTERLRRKIKEYWGEV